MQSVLTFTPGGAPLRQSLGFTAVSVICDNYTSSYLILTDAGKTIPPWTYGATVSLPDGIRQANATLVATVPAMPGPPVPLSQATLTWTDQLLPADPGHILSQATVVQQSVIGTLVLPADGSNHAIDAAVPNGTFALGFIHKTGSGTAILTIQGDQEGFSYASAVDTSKTSGFQKFDFSGADTTVAFIGNNGSGAVTTYDLLAFGYPAVSNVQPVGGVMPVSEQNATPADWQAAQLSATLTKTATGTFTLVAGSPGLVVRVLSWSLASDGQAAGGVRTRIQPHGGNAFAWFSANPVGSVSGPGGGVPSGAGVGIDFVVDFLPAGDSAMVGITYSQGAI